VDLDIPFHIPGNTEWEMGRSSRPPNLQRTFRLISALPFAPGCAFDIGVTDKA